MSKKDAILAWVAEHHPHLYAVASGETGFVLICGQPMKSTVMRLPKSVEVDFNREEGDWFWSCPTACASEEDLMFKVNISDPTYFEKLDETIRKTGL